MSAPSILLSGLGWSTPDGDTVLTGIDLRFGPERTGLVGRNGTGKTTLLRLIAGEISPSTGSVRVDGSIGRLRQDLADRRVGTVAGLFGVSAALDLIDRAARGEAGEDELAEADWTLPSRIEAALTRCGLDAGPGTGLGRLSGGQRTRAGLAALLFADPDFLLLDEPTNTLDRDGRRAAGDFLAGWRKGAVVVSHDRQLLDGMDAIVELSGLGASRYGGNYSAFRLRKDEELRAAEHSLADADKARTEAGRRMQKAAERKARKDGAGRRSRSRNDQPKILLDAKKARSEASGGANDRLREARTRAADEALAAARARVEVLAPVRMDIAPTGLPSGRTVLRIEGAWVGHVPGHPVIRDLSLVVTGPERIALCGPNGSGKSTLLAMLTGALPPWQGHASIAVPHALLDQSVSLLDPEATVRDNLRRLDPDTDDNRCRAVLARFLFRTDDALRRAGDLSGGERLRAGLACTLGRTQPPSLLILDEPTNHLDLDAMDALERALSAYDGALLVVSHDAAFLDRLALTRRLELPG